MSDGILGLVEVDSISVMEEGEGSMLEPGAVSTSIRELRDMFFGSNPILRYDLTVTAPTSRSAELRGRAFVRAKNPFSPSFVGVGRVRKKPQSGVRGKYTVTVNVRG